MVKIGQVSPTGETNLIRRLFRSQPLPLVQEPNSIGVHTGLGSVRVLYQTRSVRLAFRTSSKGPVTHHELLQRRRPLDLERDFVLVLANN